MDSNILLQPQHVYDWQYIGMLYEISTLRPRQNGRCFTADIFKCIFWNENIWNSLKVLLHWKSTSVYTSWAYSTYHLELALSTFIHHFISACLVCHTSWGKNISKFVFENSRFQIAYSFQSLLCDGRSAVVIKKSCTCWATIVILSLFLWNQQKMYIG